MWTEIVDPKNIAHSLPDPSGFLVIIRNACARVISSMVEQETLNLLVVGSSPT